MDLATYPSTELLRILAMLLQQIASANDDIKPRGGNDSGRRAAGHSHSHGRDTSGHAPDRSHESQANGTQPRMQRTESGMSVSGSGTRSRSGSMRAGQEGLHGGESSRLRVTTAAQAALMTPSSTLCFHARNVPTINIESYLLRILKYCPTTNEVFLSLLVYFDRMSRMGSGAEPGEDNKEAPAGQAAGLPQSRISASFGGLSHDERMRSAGDEGESSSHREPRPGMRGFAIDSFNVHRLIIAGLTVSSKFFSDVFYTNSRYAKVGGLPVHELNQLELQFLLLNDFHMVIPLEELQRYADQLLIYGRGQQQTKSVPRPMEAVRQQSQSGHSHDRAERSSRSQHAIQSSSSQQQQQQHAQGHAADDRHHARFEQTPAASHEPYRGATGASQASTTQQQPEQQQHAPSHPPSGWHSQNGQDAHSRFVQNGPQSMQNGPSQPNSVQSSQGQQGADDWQRSQGAQNAGQPGQSSGQAHFASQPNSFAPANQLLGADDRYQQSGSSSQPALQQTQHL
ncbi:cyclin-like protein interacting with PHO85 [Tilletia horrida]|nr:cyclin-like protein interacting with PHO85 [Tilletia horrida]